MDALFAELSRAAPASRLLGWLNFSDGKPDPRWQRQLDDVYHIASSTRPAEPWSLIRDWWDHELAILEGSDNAAFKDTNQVRGVVGLVFDHVLPAYRKHHADLLGHATDSELFTAFFVARVCEAVLSQNPPWSEIDRIVPGSLQKLNDYVGHRPVPVLETRAQNDIYAHEKVRPVPIYLHGAGAAKGKYQFVVERALDLLRETDPDILAEACFDPAALSELAIDPRAYDHGHPVNRRPNYVFGEWDPHHIDSQGRYRRFVVRRCTLDAILARVDQHPASQRDEYQFEAAAVFAGTILMAAGTSGSGPATFDSSVTLAKLVPRIARYRDAFYKRLITAVGGKHGERLRTEATQWRQPFALARQHLNQELARQRAVEMQDSMLALLFAEMGYPEASLKTAMRIPATSVRMLAGIRTRLASGHLAIRRGEVAQAARRLVECEDLLHRGIECGALADPWNALGFQGLFPLFMSREDSIHDPRLDELIETIHRIFHLHADAQAAAASAGDAELRKSLMRRFEKLAKWWDRHATHEVADLPRVHGGERAAAAEHVATALAGIRTADGGAGDLAYWRQQREGFRSPSAFAQVVEALLQQGDIKASLSLLMTWLSEAAAIPLEQGEASFHALAHRWLVTMLHNEQIAPSERVSLIVRFFALLEANAEEFWDVPELALMEQPAEGEEPEEIYEAAYEEMSYRDSTDDGEEGGVIGDDASYFPLDEEAEELEARLEFLTAVGGFWQSVVPFLRRHGGDSAEMLEAVAGWRETATDWRRPLLELLDRLHQLKIPEPVGGFEDVMEYDRRRLLRDQLAETVIDTCLETSHALRLLGSLLPGRPDSDDTDPPWEAAARRVAIALGRGDPTAVRNELPEFLRLFRTQPLLFVPMSAGGHPKNILRSRQAQSMLRFLLEQLPKIGLIRETFHLIRIARLMEQNAAPEGRKISEFDHLFPSALQSVLDALLDAAHQWPRAELDGEERLVELLRRITDSFLSLWLEHSQTLRLSVLESLTTNAEWEALRTFIKKFGSDLFTPQFLALANLRSLLHRGIGAWLDSLEESGESLLLLHAIEEGKYDRKKAEENLEIIVHAMIEHHEEYRDYNSTTTQSDYGENLHYLLDFLKLKVTYDRYAWRMRPLVQAHAVLCRRGQDEAAIRWQTSMAGFSKKLADQLLAELSDLERKHGLRLRTIRDRLEERFIQPLLIDRLCATVEPAMREAANPPATGGAFAKLQEQLPALTSTPIGIGLDPPDWLQRLDEEVADVRDLMLSGEGPVEYGLSPGAKLSYADLQRQLEQWEKPL